NTKRLIKKGIHLNKKNINQLGERIRESLTCKGRCLVAYIGSPGSGKSTIARLIRQHGFLAIPKEQLFVIDDLRGPDNRKYRRKDLPALIETLNNRVLFMFDFRAAIYLKRADIGILALVGEEERLQNLKKRSAWGFKKYKRRYYRTPPIPIAFNKRNIFICLGDVLNLLAHKNDSTI
ncbi:MAG: hypothetical protein KAJ15_00035, partial [Spirochaetes bacterium]|nr:hypothetical protein [Spirochaetota bacterium]